MPVVAWIGLAVAVVVGLVVIYFVVGSIVEAVRASRAQKTSNPAAAAVEIPRKNRPADSRGGSPTDAQKRRVPERDTARAGGEDEAILEAIRKLEKKAEKQ